MTLKAKIFTVDAFTEKAFSGNQAAVILLENPLEHSSHYQNLASELNLAETAFLHLLAAEPNNVVFSLRWFTPTVEIDLCGHATLASAHVLFFEKHMWSSKLQSLNCEEIKFQTQSGELKVSKDEKIKGLLAMNFPAGKPRPLSLKPEEMTALKKAMWSTSEINFIETGYCDLNKDMILQLQPEDFRSAVASKDLLLDLHFDPPLPLRGIQLTTTCDPLSGNQFDFLTRFFAPWSGILEDPVTGSAHATLGAFWEKKKNQKKFVAQQCSPRTGVVHIEMMGERVLLKGFAKVMIQGKISLN